MAFTTDRKTYEQILGDTKEARLGNQQMEEHKAIAKARKNGTFIDISQDYDARDGISSSKLYNGVSNTEPRTSPSIRTACHVCTKLITQSAHIVKICAKFKRRPVCANPKCQRDAWKAKDGRKN